MSDKQSNYMSNNKWCVTGLPFHC